MRHRHLRDGPALLHIGPDGPDGPTDFEDAEGGAGLAVPLEIAASYRARTRGLLGRDGIDGALLLTPAASVHTFRMRFAIDVAYLGRAFEVLAVTTMPPGRLGLPRLRARHVLEAEAGALARWGVRPGSRLGITLVRADRTGPPQGPGQGPRGAR
ncbi:DUF192 domain-containing protein [Streptomyces sp. NPDC051211]|uniref:DUF192 domain-containing protein n=1 Tax=Streptomyces sp. NPDC051211 TaxID=3154643 RepID=UPI00344EEED2